MALPQLIGDRYEVAGPLGRGGMAEVYEARDRVLDRSVAVKVLSERFSHDDRFVTRFRREAQAAARLNHRNIVSVYDTGSANGTPYIVMEKVDGPTLADVLRAEGPLPAERATEIGAAVAEALEAAHREGLVHRDVKPGNVMITRGGEVKVLDFGIARAVADDTLTQTGTVLGTASYLSPEQASGKPVDPRSDVYSLGCVLYEMLTGRPPFNADSAVQVAYQQVHEEPPTPSEAGASVDPALEGVVMRALRKDPSERFASGGAMRDALLGAAVPVAAAPTEPVEAGGDTAVLPPQTEPVAPPGHATRRPWVIALLGLLLAGLLAVGAFALLGDDRRGERDRGTVREPATEEPAPPATVGEAFAALQDVVSEGISLGEVGEDTGARILEDAAEAVALYEASDLEGAFAKLDDALSEVDRGVEDGEITSEQRVAAIVGALTALRDAMEANPPEPAPEETIAEPSPAEEEGENGSEEDGGDDGEGDGEDPGQGEEKSKGKAKGHDK